MEEVSTGTGKIIPSSKEQVIQSLDGDILTTLNVKEGEIVERGQVLAQLDPTRFESNVGESDSLLVSSRATSARLRAEVTGEPLVFPEEVLKYPKLVKEETALYQSRRANLQESVAGLEQALLLVQQELE
ncbi:biotin/lipoyl-binding protein, partial [Acinetobacter baumannii]